MTDMTTYADAMKEIGIAMERVPANRGYGGDLYSQLARRYEKACHFSGAGSVTILTVTTMPGNDVTHPVPDNTGYITEGQFYLQGRRHATHSAPCRGSSSTSWAREDPGGSWPGHEHHDPPLLRGQGCGAKQAMAFGSPI